MSGVIAGAEGTRTCFCRAETYIGIVLLSPVRFPFFQLSEQKKKDRYPKGGVSESREQLKSS